jgi:hypothetical protein
LGVKLPVAMPATMEQMPGPAPVSSLECKLLRRVPERARGDGARGEGWTACAAGTRRCEVSVRCGGRLSARAAGHSRAHAHDRDRRALSDFARDRSVELVVVQPPAPRVGARVDGARGGGRTVRAVETRRCEVSARCGGIPSAWAAERSRAHAQVRDRRALSDFGRDRSAELIVVQPPAPRVGARVWTERAGEGGRYARWGRGGAR